MWWWSTEKRKIICRQNIEYINSRKKGIKATLFSLQRISFLQLGSLYLSVLWYLDTNIALNYIDNQGGNQTFNVNYSYFMQPALALLIGSFDHRPGLIPLIKDLTFAWTVHCAVNKPLPKISIIIKNNAVEAVVGAFMIYWILWHFAQLANIKPSDICKFITLCHIQSLAFSTI